MLILPEGIADNRGLSRGTRIPSLDPWSKLIAAIGTSRLGGFWDFNRNLVSSSGNLVTWDDVRGSSGFGPTLLPNGGAGGTAPTVSSGTVNTNGSSSYIANGTASSLFNLHNTAHTLIVYGEMTGTPPYWGGLMDSIGSPSDYELWQPNGSTKVQLISNGSNQPTPAKVQPGSGVRSLFIFGRNTKYPWDSSGFYDMRAEWVGRGMSWLTTQAEHTATTGFLSLGHLASYYGIVKARGIIFLKSAMTNLDRCAIEQFVTDPIVAAGVSLYGASDSTGLVHCTGDSLTYGAGATTVSITTPVSTSATNYPAKVQSLLNAASKAIDTMDTGEPSQLINGFVNLQTGQTTTYMQDIASSLSPARRAAGLKEVMVLWMGTNDIAGGRTAAQVEADLATAVALVHSVGGRIALCTIIPRGGWFGSASETARLALNTWIMAGSSGADLAINLSLVEDGTTFFLADPSGGSDTITNNATYYNADTIHMTDLGYSKIGSYVYTALSGASLI